MDKIKSSNRSKHKRRIKDIQEDFMTQNITVIALYILNHSHQTSDQDQGTGEVEHVYMFLPRHIGLGRFKCRRGVHAFVKDERDDDEDAESDDLDEKADEDYILAKT